MFALDEGCLVEQAGQSPTLDVVPPKAAKITLEPACGKYSSGGEEKISLKTPQPEVAGRR